MLRDEMHWLQSNKCKYCKCELDFRTGTERVICKYCGRINYKNKKVKFENKLKRKILDERRKNHIYNEQIK